jgi:antitoxin ParD1/3/4
MEASVMATKSVSKPSAMKDWVEAQTRDGRYSNSSDYVRDLIRRDPDRQRAIAELQEFVDQAVSSGPAERFDVEAFLAWKRDQTSAAERSWFTTVAGGSGRP